jgi:hypothetical protein
MGKTKRSRHNDKVTGWTARESFLDFREGQEFSSSPNFQTGFTLKLINVM